MTLSWVLAAMLLLAPGRDHAELGAAIAKVVDDEPPIFRDDTEKVKTAALVVAVAFRESTFRNDAIGDKGHSVCAMQIYDGPRELLTDPVACVRRGLAMLRTSAKIDPKNPVAFYARGPGWKTETAQKISRDRMALAQRLVREVTP